MSKWIRLPVRAVALVFTYAAMSSNTALKAVSCLNNHACESEFGGFYRCVHSAGSTGQRCWTLSNGVCSSKMGTCPPV
jgi:hypothetical protein